MHFGHFFLGGGLHVLLSGIPYFLNLNTGGVGSAIPLVQFLVQFLWFSSSGPVPQVKPQVSSSDQTQKRELTLVRANLIRVISPSNTNTGGFRGIFSSLYPFLISFSCFTFPDISYRIFLLFLPWLPCHFYLVITTATMFVHGDNLKG